jgi:hypothetical protein
LKAVLGTGMMDIEAPFNTFASESIGPSEEHMLWASAGSIYPVCPDMLDSQKVNTIFKEEK